MSRCACVILAIVAACGNGGTGPGTTAEPAKPAGSAAAAPPASPGPAAAPPASPGPAAAAPAAAESAKGCEALPFASDAAVPEASGAAWLTLDGKPGLLVVSDSGNHGEYAIVDPDSGATRETGALPLSSETSDDIEGVAARGDKIYGITSSGWIYVWQRRGRGFAQVGKPYALGPVDLPDRKNNDRAPEGDGMVCNPKVVNCGRNYEGLCLANRPRSPACIGFAASKADGHLYCVSDAAGKLVVHRDRAIAITRPGALADCAFGDDDTLWVGSNLFDLGHVYRIAGWDDPATAKREMVGALVVGFPETIAARGDVVYRMSDTGGTPSMMARYRCPR